MPALSPADLAAVAAADLLIVRDPAEPGRVAYVPVRGAGDWSDVPRVVAVRLDSAGWHAGLAELWRLALQRGPLDPGFPPAGAARP